VFNTTYNPERLRIGSRILHQRLRGPAVASYYPPRIGTISQLRSLYPHNEIIDDEEEDWLEHHGVARSRGKGTPKKKRTAAGKLVWDYLGRRVLTEGRIEEVQQAQVSGRNTMTRMTAECRACICTVNEAWDGVIYGRYRFCTGFEWYTQDSSSTTTCFWRRPHSSSTAFRIHRPTELALSCALAVLAH
jgi:small subunit ribosomal protein S33